MASIETFPSWVPRSQKPSKTGVFYKFLRTAGYSNALLAALNIASGGLFWWQQPTHLSRFYDSLIDLENNVKAEIGRSPELKIGWPRAVLDAETLDRVVVAFVAMPKPDDRAKHEPFNHYLTGVGYLAKTDVFLQFEFQAYGAFLASLTAALRLYLSLIHISEPTRL